MNVTIIVRKGLLLKPKLTLGYTITTFRFPNIIVHFTNSTVKTLTFLLNFPTIVSSYSMCQFLTHFHIDIFHIVL